MSDCKKCQILFAEAFYDELNADQRHFLENHLKGCARCRSEFSEMESTLEIMDKRIRPEPGKAFWDNFRKRVVNKIEEEKPLDSDVVAWRLAWKLSQAGKSKTSEINDCDIINIYVVDDSGNPVRFYGTNELTVLNVWETQ